MVDVIQENIAAIKAQIKDAALTSGLASAEIKLMAVSKTRSIEEMLRASEFAEMLGENRIQEAAEKRAGWPGVNKTPWHLIGRLQRNKARKALEIFDVIESVDSLDLARALNRILSEGGRGDYRIFLEVNMSGEISKSGVNPDEAERLLEMILDFCPNLRVEGLMTIGPMTCEETVIRASFAGLRRLRDRMRTSFGLPLPELSMGMSGDFLTAIAEGSTIVRVGTAIFGARIS